MRKFSTTKILSAANAYFSLLSGDSQLCRSWLSHWRFCQGEVVSLMTGLVFFFLLKILCLAQPRPKTHQKIQNQSPSLSLSLSFGFRLLPLVFTSTTFFYPASSSLSILFLLLLLSLSLSLCVSCAMLPAPSAMMTGPVAIHQKFQPSAARHNAAPAARARPPSRGSHAARPDNGHAAAAVLAAAAAAPAGGYGAGSQHAQYPPHTHHHHHANPHFATSPPLSLAYSAQSPSPAYPAPRAPAPYASGSPPRNAPPAAQLYYTAAGAASYAAAYQQQPQHFPASSAATIHHSLPQAPAPAAPPLPPPHPRPSVQPSPQVSRRSSRPPSACSSVFAAAEDEQPVRIPSPHPWRQQQQRRPSKPAVASPAAQALLDDANTGFASALSMSTSSSSSSTSNWLNMSLGSAAASGYFNQQPRSDWPSTTSSTSSADSGINPAASEFTPALRGPAHLNAPSAVSLTPGKALIGDVSMATLTSSSPMRTCSTSSNSSTAAALAVLAAAQMVSSDFDRGWMDASRPVSPAGSSLSMDDSEYDPLSLSMSQYLADDLFAGEDEEEEDNSLTNKQVLHALPQWMSSEVCNIVKKKTRRGCRGHRKNRKKREAEASATSGGGSGNIGNADLMQPATLSWAMLPPDVSLSASFPGGYC